MKQYITLEIYENDQNNQKEMQQRILSHKTAQQKQVSLLSENRFAVTMLTRKKQLCAFWARDFWV